MTQLCSTSNKPPKDTGNVVETHETFRIYKQNTPYTKDPKVYALGMETAITMTVPAHAHKLKRQTLDPCFSKRRVNMMEDGLYEELDLVFDKIREFEGRGEDVPIQEMFYCFTVGFLPDKV